LLHINCSETPLWALDVIDASYESPVFTFRPSALTAAVNYFRNNLFASILYAVKANPSLHVLRHLIRLGINQFDVASLEEVKLVYNQLPSAELYFMHPIKSRRAIRIAYFEYGVRHFSLDSEEELEKILVETDHACDLKLHVRLAIPNTYSEMSLAEKFGIDSHHAPSLLSAVAMVCENVGVCFHVGSQCMHPDAYCIAIRIAETVISQANVPVHYFNVGGGFPSIYPGMHPPPLIEYFQQIHQSFSQIPNYKNMQLLSEPGRALVAESGSLVVNVTLRKGNVLYINSGTYGALFDAGMPKFIFPTRLLRPNNGPNSSEMKAFHLYGPTCDALDYMPGPFYLPADIREGDFIEVGQLGAYSCTLATQFNGFTHQGEIVEIDDRPLMTLYQQQSIQHEKMQLIM
jgi:ornithine decarboxylase